MVSPNDMSFRANESESRNLPKLQTLPCVGYYCNLGGFLHSACAAVGMTYRGVVPFTHTGYFCHVSGTAHRPFPTVSLKGITIHLHRLYSERGGRQIAAPTVSLVGVFFHPHGLYSSRCLAMNHRRYIAWYHSPAQVIFGTWRVADCR